MHCLVGWDETYLAMLSKNTRRNLRILLHKLEDRITHDLRSRASKVHQRFKPRVRFTENTVTVAGHDLARLKGAPEILLDVLVGELVADLGAHVQDPAEDFLRGETV